MRDVVQCEEDRLQVRPKDDDLFRKVPQVRREGDVQQVRPPEPGPVPHINPQVESQAHRVARASDFRAYRILLQARRGQACIPHHVRQPDRPVLHRRGAVGRDRGLLHEGGTDDAFVQVQGREHSSHQGAGACRHRDVWMGDAAVAAIPQTCILRPADAQVRRGHSNGLHRAVQGHSPKSGQQRRRTGCAHRGVDERFRRRNAGDGRAQAKEPYRRPDRPVSDKLPDARRRGQAACAQGDHTAGDDRPHQRSWIS